jgi:AcrR family transcriptional regulator
MDKYHHGNLKAVLLKAAFQLVGKIGAEGFTLREVARRAGVSHNAPYRHFKSKEDLIAALATEAFRQLHEALRKSVAAGDDPGEQLRAASRAYLHFALENRPRFNVMFHSTFDRDAYPEYISAYSESLTLLGGLIEANRGVKMDTETAEDLVWASIHGIAELGLAKRLRKGAKRELEVLVDAAIATLLGGMKEVA